MFFIVHFIASKLAENNLPNQIKSPKINKDQFVTYIRRNTCWSMMKNVTTFEWM